MKMEVDYGQNMEGSSDLDEKIGRKSSLIDHVFAWSLEDMFNENLYTKLVKKIPESFETVPEYFGSYVYPLLEETRADLCSSLPLISKAPYAEVVSHKKVKPLNSFTYNVNVDSWRNRFNDRGKEPYKPWPGDIFALVKFRPDTQTDLEMVARTWILASATKVPKGQTEVDADDESSTFFTVEMSKDISELDDGYSSLFLIFLRNTLTYKRIWSALHKNGNLKIIEGVLHRNVMDGDTQNPRAATVNRESEKLCMDLSSSLNPSQIEAVLASVQATQSYHKSQVQLVWGPPGTGKTKTIGTLLYFLLKMNVRTLVCAPTNVAITEVANRVLELVQNSSSGDSSKNFGMLGSILLFGNKQRLRVGSDIYVDYRVKRLAECFAPLTGWRTCFPCLSNFLENCVSDYVVYVDNELIKTKELGIDDVVAIRQVIPFTDFFRSRYIAAAQSVWRCISVFDTHIARNFIGECNVACLRRLRGLLHSFPEMLKDYSNSDELLKLFSSAEVEDSQLDALPLIEVERRECISVLTTLYRSLGDLDLPYATSYESLSDMCFRMASLIFCTASSSSKLYFMPIEPLNLLVIDEAAQLKECETAIPLQLPGLRHAILFGDECQLPAMVQSNVSAKAGFGRSLFQRLSVLGSEKKFLNMQYRMHPSISAFPNTEFYLNQILDAPSVTSRMYEKRYLAEPMYGPYSFINISEGRDEVDDDGRSRRNMVEAAAVAKILKNLYKTWHHSTQKLAIGVVSPYAAQVVAIKDLLGKRYENLNNFGVKVKSVDGFQGGEEDIIILSTVRANNAGQIGFISDCQRTNVALTRARYCLWVLGNEKTLSISGSIWSRVVFDAKARNCFFNAEEDKSLAEAMIDMKKELNQLEDLLNKDSIIFKSARWKVLFSDSFVKSFSKLPSTRAKKSVMNVLVKLSNGWRPKKIRVDPVCESAVQIVKQYKVEGRYIITTNDIVKETIYTQVMKIWDIVPLEDVSALVRRLDNVYGAFTDDFLNRCKEKGLEGDCEVPRTWNTSSDIVRLKNTNADESTTAGDGDLDAVTYAENSKVSESLILMKFYSLSTGTVGHLLSDSDGKALDLPFEVTDKEMEIILHDKSSFILGRSGTGKTTVCFERAGDKHWETLAKGLGLKAAAGRINEVNPEEAAKILRQAGELFESINVYGKAAECYFELKDYDKARKLYFHHCDDSCLEKAGECFTLAGCYELAATVYAKCNRFSECLASCTKGKLYDIGLQYIQYWKHQNTAHDLDKIEQEFLENCALSQLQQDDKKAMMKFVTAFSLQDSMRAFLSKWECLDELLSLEEELGNFSKAADITRERGEFLLEADLLYKGGFFNEACEYFMWHIFASCLWAEGSKGWPLKHFPGEEELLLKAKSSANSSEQHHLYKMVCTDILILLNRNYSLSQLREFLVVFQNHTNLRGKLVSTKKILDLILHTHSSKFELEVDLITNLAKHSLQKISQDMVSVETMIYFWESWQQTIMAILKYLNAAEANDSDFPVVGEFCLNYLGVRKLPSKTGTVYVCLYPDAEWLKEVNKGFFKKFGKLVSIDVVPMAAAAQNYWTTELVSTGMKVLSILAALLKRAKESPLFEFGKTRLLLLVHEVAQLLSSLISGKQYYHDSKLIQSYLDSSAKDYFRSIFPLDWRKVVSKDIICLREMDISSKILEEVILMNVEGKEDMTYGQLGRVAMGLLGLPKCETKSYEMVVKRLDKDTPWRQFFEVLSTCKLTESLIKPPNRVNDTPEFALADKLLGCLRNAYHANWRVARDYITPYHFLYLADRLMISLLEFQGRMFITRSSLVEWFNHLKWNGNLITNLSTDGMKSGILKDTYNFLARVVYELLMNTKDTVAWVKRVGIKAKDNFPVLLLRLVTIMCLIPLNTRNHREKLVDVLRSDVSSQLPPAFRDALRKSTDFNAVALALKTVGDPLVIVSIGVVRQPLSCSDAISLDIDNRNKEDLLRILFPSEMEATSDNINHQANVDSREMLNKDSVFTITEDWNVWELFETLKLVIKEDDKSWDRFVSKAANVKVQVDKLHDLIKTVTAVAPEKEPLSDEYSSMLAKSQRMLLELRLLSAVLGSSGQLKDSMLLIRDITEKLLSGKQAFEYFLTPLFPPKDTTSLETHEADNDTHQNIVKDNVEDRKIHTEADQELTWEEAEDEKNNDASLSTNGNEGSSQGGGNNKGKPNKKGKGKKKKKGKK